MNQHNAKRTFLFRIILWVAICIIAVLLILNVILYFIWVPPHRDLGYGALFLWTDEMSKEEAAEKSNIKVYDISGRIRTKELSADVVLNDPVNEVSGESVIIFLDEHLNTDNGCLDMLYSNYWKTIGSFKYDAVIVYTSNYGSSATYFVNTKKEVMYRLIDTGGTYTWGAKTLTVRQAEVLGLN